MSLEGRSLSVQGLRTQRTALAIRLAPLFSALALYPRLVADTGPPPSWWEQGLKENP